MVLPSAKRATKKLRDRNAASVKLLSKKKRKLLEKIVEQKEKKAKVYTVFVFYILVHQ